MRACGIVLAGGRGVRLAAGVPKARVPLAGATLAERAVATLAAACDGVLVAAPADVDPGAPGARRVTDAAGFAGPLAGLVAALEACDADAAVVLGADFPLVTPALARALLDRLSAAGAAADAVVPRPGGTAQPLVAAYARRAAAPLRAALESGVTSLRGGLGRLVVHWLDDADIATLPGGAAALLNVNTPGDLDRAALALEARAGGATP